jgi:luciferase family oxidoreductase group 1
MIPFSILDLAPVAKGSTPADAFRNSLELAQHAERLGYNRFWLAEHHNMPGIASAATSVVIAHVAGGTKTIRVGAGGVMLPNHSPLVIAEQFGTLESLFPGRVDLGLGRAPGTDQTTARALRRNLIETSEQFGQDVAELLRLFEPADGAHSFEKKIRAVPGTGLRVPVWLLGSSTFSAELAAQMGLPFCFASHFAPGDLVQAFSVYRESFRPSQYLAKPYAMMGVNVIAADTDAEARRLFTSQQQAFVYLRRGVPGLIPPPVESMDAIWTPQEKAMVEYALGVSVVGSPETVEHGLSNIINAMKPDEIIIPSHMYAQADRLRSFALIAEAKQRLAMPS